MERPTEPTKEEIARYEEVVARIEGRVPKGKQRQKTLSDKVYQALNDQDPYDGGQLEHLEDKVDKLQWAVTILVDIVDREVSSDGASNVLEAIGKI